MKFQNDINGYDPYLPILLPYLKKIRRFIFQLFSYFAQCSVGSICFDPDTVVNYNFSDYCISCENVPVEKSPGITSNGECAGEKRKSE